MMKYPKEPINQWIYHLLNSAVRLMPNGVKVRAEYTCENKVYCFSTFPDQEEHFIKNKDGRRQDLPLLLTERGVETGYTFLRHQMPHYDEWE